MFKVLKQNIHPFNCFSPFEPINNISRSRTTVEHSVVNSDLPANRKYTRQPLTRCLFTVAGEKEIDALCYDKPNVLGSDGLMQCDREFSRWGEALNNANKRTLTFAIRSV